MDQEAYQRAQALGLCMRCVCLFINSKYEDIFLKEEDFIQQYVISKLSLNALPEYSENYVCPCCMNCLTKVQQMAQVVDKMVGEAHTSAHNQTIYLNIITPPVFETVRIACRTIVTNSPIKLGPFPCWDELLSRLIGKILEKKHLICNDIEDAKVKVDIVINFHDEINLAYAVDPKFEKSKKRRLQGVQLQVVDHNFAFERRDEDNLLATIKTFAKDLKLLKYLSDRLKTYFTQQLPSPPPSCSSLSPAQVLVSEGCPLSWTFSVYTQPIYLIGRYRKLSREISQAKWTVTEENDEYDEESSAAIEINQRLSGNTAEESHGKDMENSVESNCNTNSKLKCVRKGKMSVEEIVCEAVNHAMKAKTSRLHPCGREDIDVRMLGNGRPFVVEVLEAKEAPTQEIIQQAVDFVSAGRGLNVDQDVDVLILEETTHKTWTTMQHVAEEKRKGYSCICWSANTLTREIITQIENTPNTCGNVDSEGVPCLEITQKTPLRVLHRRSALTRTRYIYHMSAARLNDHYFVLHLTTSAGAYVKEFVHGDLGRTFPSIASLISSPTDILQLDVTWLYDSFVGNGNDNNVMELGDTCETTGDDKATASKNEQEQNALTVSATAAEVLSTKLYKVSELAHTNISWESLQQMPLASFAPNASLNIHRKSI